MMDRLASVDTKMHSRLASGLTYITSFKEAIASMTSLVKVLPCPDVPIKTVGLICWEQNIEM